MKVPSFAASPDYPLCNSGTNPKTLRLKYQNHKKAVKELNKLLKNKKFRRGSKAKIEVIAEDAADNDAIEKLTVKKLKR